MDESRKQFEEWIANTTNSDVHRGIMLDRRESGSYRHLATENKWEAWQASRAAIDVELPLMKAEHSSDQVAFNGGVKMSAKSIRAAGLKIKGE